jgi:O-antigen ligase
MRAATFDIADHGAAIAPAPQRRSAVHWLALAFVAVTILSSGFVFSEPAPVDALTIGLIVLLPVVGLVAFNPTLIAYFSLWTVAGACAVLAAALSLDLGITLTHVGVTLYLTLASVVFAGFIAKSPTAHTHLILNAWTWAAVVAAACGLIGYFSLFPGAYELFTKFGRAAGTFKDPNVFGPFLVGPFIYMLHVALGRSWRGMIAPLSVAGLLMLTVLLTFSRGAWMNVAVALAIFGYLTMLTTRKSITRVKLMALLAGGMLFAAGLVAVALSTDYISDLLLQRSTLEMEYDSGSEGRFGGQQKAIGLITENPLGIGALEFGERYHPEEVHNVYLSMVLNAGWLGGGIYWIIVGLTAVLGFRHALKRTPTQPLFLIVYAAFMANAMEGIIIDSDHWRHFYLLAAMVWGLMSARTVAQPAMEAAWTAATTMWPRRPAKLRPAVELIPPRRHRPPGLVGALA